MNTNKVTLHILAVFVISLETVLSDAGVISQIPVNWITLMSSGRSHVVDCGEYGHTEFGTLRPVVEKELLHHDILREMSDADLLVNLTFIGGTCLRACYGSQRLSEDLDFTGGI